MAETDDAYSPFGTYHVSEKVAVLIDGPSLYNSIRGLGWELDYGVLRQWFARNSDLRRLHYYGALPENTDLPSPVKPLCDWLDFHGYKTNIKTIRERQTVDGPRLDRPNLMPEMATDLMQIAYQPANRVDRFVIFSGDRELEYPLYKLSDMGFLITMIGSTRQGAAAAGVADFPYGGTISDSLRVAADCFVELSSLRPILEKKRSDTTVVNPRLNNRMRSPGLASVG
jgi:uncharacterized LabA/DUF88 family protein